MDTVANLARQDVAETLVAIFKTKPQQLACLAKSPFITMDVIERHPDNRWYKTDGFGGSLSANPNLTINVVRQRPDVPWDWNLISTHISVSDALANRDLPIVYDRINIGGYAIPRH